MRSLKTPTSLLILFLSLLYTQTAQASNRERAYRLLDKTGIYLERMTYEEYVYSRSKKTELGDQVKLDSSVRYQYDPNNYARLRFETDPIENRFDNKTSRFELVGGHERGNFSIRVDSDLNTNDDDGSTSIGLDLDSRGTFISYRADEGWGARFYPFNFDSRVGREYYSYDVTRLYFIEGSPTNVNDTPNADEKIAVKTIPGLELSYQPPEKPQFKFYVGAGLATYLYPTNPDYDILTNRNATRWERKESFGYKAGITYLSSNPTKDMTIFNFQYSGHNQSEETGSLLAQAATLNGRTLINEKWFIDFEIGYSKAGKAPYRVDRDSDWFEQQTPFQPVYSDFFNNIQDWVGESDMAYALEFGHKYKENLPYAFIRYQGEHFIFSERQSAHLLRTADDTASHGGLTRVGLGTYQHYGNFTINPEFEWLSAKNPVFGNSSDVREDRVLSSFKKEDFLLSLRVSYNFDGDIFAQ
jgi:hypothetical protein